MQILCSHNLNTQFHDSQFNYGWKLLVDNLITPRFKNILYNYNYNLQLSGRGHGLDKEQRTILIAMHVLKNGKQYSKLLNNFYLYKKKH